MALKNYELYDGDGNLIAQDHVDFPDAPYDKMRREKLELLDGEGMDAIRKAITALAAGEPAPQEFVEYMTKVEEIKEKYPKTEAVVKTS